MNQRDLTLWSSHTHPPLPPVRFTSTFQLIDPAPIAQTCDKLFALLTEKLVGWTVVQLENHKIAIETVEIVVEETPSTSNASQQAASADSSSSTKTVLISWTNQDEDLGAYALGLLQSMG